MRDSRIAHPLGGRGVMLRTWLVREVGVAAAAVVDTLDFLDRREERAGQLVATRLRIISDLEGVVSRQSVDGALRQLVERGWIVRKEITAPGQRNIQTTHHYSLNAEAINTWISRSSENGTPEIPLSEPVPEPVTERRLKVDVDVNAAAHAAAAHAAAPSRKKWRERPSGIVTWYDSEIPDAERIEHLHEVAVIAAAVAALNAAGKQPVPGLVELELKRSSRKREQAEKERQQRERERAAAAAEEQHMAKWNAQVDAFLQSLDEAKHAAIVADFSEWLSMHNKAVFQFHRRDGLKSKSVQVEFRKFIQSHYLAQQEATA